MSEEPQGAELGGLHPELSCDGDVRIVGYWALSVRGPLAVCVPQALVARPYSDAEREAILAFLRGGERYQQERGYSWCRFASCDAPDPELGSGHGRRGQWAWPDGLAHYVEAHGVRIPGELERAALGQGPLDPPDSVGLTWWVDWCRARLPEGYEARLTRARAELEVELVRAVLGAREVVLARARDMECEQGTGDELCVKPGCEARVLAERKLCAWHVLTVNGAGEVRDARRKTCGAALWRLLEGVESSG